MAKLGLINGSDSHHPAHAPASFNLISTAVRGAVKRGFVIGSEVKIGAVAGVVVGYNIANFGQFLGVFYPLVVRTSFGISKCALGEVRLA